jgi:hypothetical protein
LSQRSDDVFPCPHMIAFHIRDGRTDLRDSDVLLRCSLNMLIQ